MEANSSKHRPFRSSASFGSITTEDLGTADLPSPRDPKRQISSQLHRYIWRPPDRYSEHLPDDFSLSLDCYTDQNGIRRFLPANTDWANFIGQAFIAGLSIRSELDGLDGGQRNCYRVMAAVFQWLRRRREHLDRKFHSTRDLFIRRPGRLSDRERSVLPSDLRLASARNRRSPQISEVTAAGRQAAGDAGYRSQKSRISIRFGLYEAAKENPLYIDDEQARTLVREALYDLRVDGEQPSRDLIDDVEHRLFRLIRDFDERNKSGNFNEWLAGPASNLPKVIAKRNLELDEPELDSKLVRKALLLIGWESYQFLANCIHSVMRTIQNAICDLDDQERRVFEQIYLVQSYHGGLPLPLLIERAEFIQNAVLRIWEDPDDGEAVAVFHRVLYFYLEMVRERRRADRCSKNKSAARNDDGEIAKHLQFKDELDGESEHSLGAEEDDTDSSSHINHDNELVVLRAPRRQNDQFSELAEYLRECHSITCANDCTQWSAYLLEDRCDDGNVVIEYTCACGETKTMSKQFDEFEKAARELLDRADHDYIDSS